MQLDDLDLGLQVNLVIRAGGKTVARRLAVLGHQDDRRLQRGQHGKNKVEEDIGVEIEWFDLPCPDDALKAVQAISAARHMAMNVQDPPNEATRSARRSPTVCFSAKVRLTSRLI